MSAIGARGPTGLLRYDAMCTAIAVCSQVDEAKEIRDRARALEVYAQQALNTEAERKAGEIRLRAERRAGELLREMKRSGQRDNGKGNRNPSLKSDAATPKLPDLGISKDQSSQWQQLAAIPEDEFEAELSKPGPKPTTEGLLNSRRPAPPAPPRIDPKALRVWGLVRDFDREVIQIDPGKIRVGFTDGMRENMQFLLPKVIDWLQRLERSCE
jgi:hypothetical protein